MRYRFALVGLLALAPTLSSCYPARAAAGSGTSPDLIGNWELRELSDFNALEAIQRLRPAWLRTGQRPAVAAGGGSGNPRVHLNGVPLQSLSELESISAADVREMRFVSGVDASTRWGTGYVNGAILVTLER